MIEEKKVEIKPPEPALELDDGMGPRPILPYSCCFILGPENVYAKIYIFDKTFTISKKVLS